MNKTTVARRYAKALFGLVEASSLEATRTALNAIARASRESWDLKQVLASPAFGFEEKMAVLAGLSKKLKGPPVLEAFLGQLVRKNRVSFLPDIAEVFGQVVDEAQGRQRVSVASATTLSKTDQDRLRKQFRDVLRQEVDLTFETQPDLLAGLRIQIGSMVFDSTVQGRLSAMQALLTRE
ncbi:MAG: ATP synthase F1 subunit delta [Nitrospirales bacterium]